MSTGKNFSCNNQGQRKKSDFYETPYSMTEQLLETNEIPDGSLVLEPACGEHAIVTVLEEKGYKIKSYDIEINFFERFRKI